MKQLSSLILFLFLIYIHSTAQPLQKQWDFSYGGYDSDFISKLLATNDGGFLVGGNSLSDSSFDKSEDNFNPGTNTYDIWIIKCDANGIKMWDRNLGGTQNDFFYNMINTSDGGVLVVGSTNSPLSGNITNPPIGIFDMYLVKLTPTGIIEWDQRFGGDAACSASDALEIPGKGYVIGGSTNCQQGFDVSQASYGSYDYWLVRIDSSGNKMWDKRYGGTSDDSGLKILVKPGGFLLVSGSISNTGGVKSQDNYVNGKSDIWCIATDTSGNIFWDKLLGSLEDDYSIDAKFTPDQNYIFSCLTYANAGADKSENTYGVDDFWVIKTDTALNKLWDHSVGGDSNEDDGGKLTITNTGNYLVTGTSYSSPGFWKTETNNGPENTWSVMIDPAGNKVWDKTVLTGYSHTEAGYAIQLNDGCFVIANDGDAFVGNDKTDISNSFDYWCVKYCDTTSVPSGVCNFNVNAGSDTTLCNGTSFQLNGITNLSPQFISSVLWQPGTGLSDSTILNPVANISGSQTYALIVKSNQGSELLFNGDFSLGDSGFYGGYIHGQGGISGIVSNPGEYDVNTSPHNSHIDFADFGDHTTGSGNMLIVNGSVNFNDTLWCQNVNVNPSSNYNFSVWASSANWQNPAILQATINGIQIGSPLYLSTDTGTWHDISAVWNSGISTTAHVCIIDLSTWSAGNDCVIDDVSLFGSCSQSDTVTISIQTTTALSIGNDTTICQGDSVVLNAPPGFVQYEWLLNNVLLADTNIAITVNQPGQYILNAVTFAGCTGSDTIIITVNSASISLGSDTSFCEGDSALITAPSGFTVYQWLLNNTPLVANTESIYAAQSGLYTVIASSASGCDASDSIVITSNPLPDIQTVEDTSICQGNSLTLFTSGGSNYTWSPSQYLNNSSLQNPISSPENTITYIVTGTDTNGCSKSDMVTVIVDPTPTSNFDYTVTVSCDGFLLKTDNLSANAQSYLWNFGDGITTSEQSPLHLYTSLQNITLQLISSNNSCSDTATKMLSGDVFFFTDLLQNIFTPNGDGINDCFYPLSDLRFRDCTEINVFNRWGETIFRSGDSNSCWNGKSDNTGEEAPAGVYFFVAKIFDKNLSGTVMLQR